MATSRSHSSESSRAVPGGMVHMEVTSPDLDEGHRMGQRCPSLEVDHGLTLRVPRH